MTLDQVMACCLTAPSHNLNQSWLLILWLTFPWFVLYVDGLCLVVAVLVLYTHKMGVGVLAEVGTQSHDMLIAIAHNLHHLKTYVHNETYANFRVGILAEVGTQSHDMLIAIAHNLHHLKTHVHNETYANFRVGALAEVGWYLEQHFLWNWS